jgi:hypothetical protein
MRIDRVIISVFYLMIVSLLYTSDMGYSYYRVLKDPTLVDVLNTECNLHPPYNITKIESKYSSSDVVLPHQLTAYFVNIKYLDFEVRVPLEFCLDIMSDEFVLNHTEFKQSRENFNIAIVVLTLLFVVALIDAPT